MPMAPRASWKGYIKLSLVSCPVRLYPAVSGSERIAFNQLHKDTHNRINMKPVDPELGLVERSDLVRGYEYEDKQYIIIEDSDLEAVKIEANHTLNIEAFVDESEIDVIYQDSPYYLAPDGAMAEETFAVLRDAMRAANRCRQHRRVPGGPRPKIPRISAQCVLGLLPAARTLTFREAGGLTPVNSLGLPCIDGSVDLN
jgi:non-homologous end joining protein Ku